MGEPERAAKRDVTAVGADRGREWRGSAREHDPAADDVADRQWGVQWNAQWGVVRQHARATGAGRRAGGWGRAEHRAEREAGGKYTRLLRPPQTLLPNFLCPLRPAPPRATLS